MNIDEGMDLETKTYERATHYNKYNARKIILTENEILEEYPYKTAKIERLENPSTYGFTDRFFGGNVKQCAVLKDDPYVLLVNANLETIGVLIPFANLSKFTVEELLLLCEKYKLETTAKMNKQAIIDVLTNL